MEQLTKDERKKLRQEEYKENLKKQETRNKIKKFAWWAGGIFFLGLAVWFVYAIVNTPSSNSSTNLTAPGPKSTDMTYGNPKAKIILTEYADFQCPGCKAYYPIVKKLTQDYGSKLFFVYRFFPLSQIHQNAIVSAEAAYAASLQGVSSGTPQGKFWQMHDILFDHQDEWATLQDPTNNFISYANQAGLNIDQFKKDYSDPKTASYIKAQEQAALNLGLPGTPTFFLNNKQIVTPSSYDEFRKVIHQALANAK